MIFRDREIENILWALNDRVWELTSEVQSLRRSLQEDENKARLLERSERDSKHNNAKRDTEKKSTIWT